MVAKILEINIFRWQREERFGKPNPPSFPAGEFWTILHTKGFLQISDKNSENPMISMANRLCWLGVEASDLL
jgi:hypothetical protein